MSAIRLLCLLFALAVTYAQAGDSQTSSVGNAIAKPEDQCHKANMKCASNVQCCSGLYCDSKGGTCDWMAQTSSVGNAIAKPEDQCLKAADKCAFASQCCSGLFCDKKQYWLDGSCNSIPTQCIELHVQCDYVGAPSCCKGSYCNPSTGACFEGKPCEREGGDCAVDYDCCTCASSGLPHPASCKAKKCFCSNQVIV